MDGIYLFKHTYRIGRLDISSFLFVVNTLWISDLEVSDVQFVSVMVEEIFCLCAERVLYLCG
jgi:hypothetical protein